MALPGYVTTMLEWAVGLLLSHLDQDTAKKGVVMLLEAIDGIVQEQDARVDGPLKGLADEVAVAFHGSVQSIVKTLQG